jgi:hypothetical protein
MVMTTIKKALLKPTKVRGSVVLSREEYLRLCMAAAPVVQLKGKAAEALDKSVEKALREHREGKTRTKRSLADLD